MADAGVGVVGGPGPVVNKGPMTNNPALNLGLGTAIAAVPNVGFGAALSSMDPLATAIHTGTAALLNVVAQLVKQIRYFPEATPYMMAFLCLVGVGLSYFLFYHADATKAVINGSCGAMTAIGNYKADKAAGTFLMAPLPPEREFPL